MPASIHNCVLSWLSMEVYHEMIRTGFITVPEARLLMVTCESTFATLGPPHTLSRKEPYHCITPFGEDLPTLVVESGWTEPNQDMRLWIKGGSGAVQVALLFKWSELDRFRVKADLEVYNLNPTGNENLLQTEAIFPVPNAAAPQVITITRGQLFGGAIPMARLRDGQQNDTYNLSLDNLREFAIESLRVEGFIPA